MSPAKQIVVYFDPVGEGHHAEYLAFFLSVCDSLGLTLAAWVPQEVWDIAKGITRAGPSAGFLAKPVDFTVGTLGQRQRALADMFAYAQAERVELIFFGMLDGLVKPLALRRLAGHKSTVPWTGIFMIDDFNFPNVTRGLLASLRLPFKLMGLRLALRGGAVSLLASNPAWPARMPVPIIWLPDNLSSLDFAAQQSVEESGIWPVRQEPNKTGPCLRLASFGVITPRKGLVEFCNGLSLLSDADLARVEFRIMGEMPRVGSPDYVARLHQAVAKLKLRGMAVEFQQAYVSERLIDQSLRWCDVVVAPYINHIGSSSLINIAAQYGRPVITQATSQIGYEARNFQLGICLDSRDAVATAAAVRGLLEKPFEPTEGMKHFSQTHSYRQAFAVSANAIAQAAGLGGHSTAWAGGL